jgi:hypothetical protein
MPAKKGKMKLKSTKNTTTYKKGGCVGFKRGKAKGLRKRK